MSAPGEEVSRHAGVIRGAEDTIGERNRSRLSRLEDRKSCVRMKLMDHILAVEHHGGGKRRAGIYLLVLPVRISARLASLS
jgi:hypothetical protein